MESIISCLSNRLLQEQIPVNPQFYMEKRLGNSYDYISNDANPLYGILKREFHNNNNVVMNASSCEDGDVYNLLKINDKKDLDFFTKDLPHSWVSASIKDNKSVYIKSYMIRGRKYDECCGQLQSWKLEVQNKNILLFDDIYTTGNTVSECIRTLKKLNPKSIGVLTIFKD